MSTQVAKKDQLPVRTMKNLISNQGIKTMFDNALRTNSSSFLSSLIDLYGDPSGNLSECDPNEVVMEALKAATLQLPINKNLGFAYIIPYAKNRKEGNNWVKEIHPQFQLGYKGLIQLAQRSGQYETINANAVYKGMEIKEDYLSGEITINGKPESDEVIGYFCYFKLINGFKKVLYMSKDEIIAHAKNFSQSYEYYDKAKKKSVINEKGPWSTNFDAMATKTVIKKLLSKYGVLSVEMRDAIAKDVDEEVESEIRANANTQMLGDGIEEAEFDPINVDEETGEVMEPKEADLPEPDEDIPDFLK